MAVSSNGSPSPISTRPNPSARTSETNSTIRRSFSGNPFARPSVLTNPRGFNPITPANSPADFARKNYCVGKEGIEKENEKDHNMKEVKLRSSAKGTKNFMSPTISAACKFTPSPRKKVLAEKNESVRTSISFSDGKSPFDSLNSLDFTEYSDSNSDIVLNQKKTESSWDSMAADSRNKEAVLEAPPIPKTSQRGIRSEVPLNPPNALESLSGITMNSDYVNVEVSSKNKSSCSSASHIIAPPDDADPSLPSYDPKTNYLSPRPLFLHYKPNPRIEVYLNKEKDIGFSDGNPLEDSFMSGNFSDTEFTDETQSEDSHKELEEASSAEILPVEEDESQVSRPMPISTSIIHDMSKETVEAKRTLKPCFFTRSRSISLLFILLIACMPISVTDFPVNDSPLALSFSNLYNHSKVFVFAKVNFYEFARNFKQWSSNSIPYPSKLIPLPGKVDKLGHLQFTNLTALQEDLLVDRYHWLANSQDRSKERFEQIELEHVREGEVEIEQVEQEAYQEVDISQDRSEERFEQIELEPVRKGEVQMEQFEHEAYHEVGANDNSEEASGHGNSKIEEVPQTLNAEVHEPDNSEVVWDQEQSDYASHMDAEPQRSINFEDQSPLVSQALTIKHEIEVIEIEAEVVQNEELHGDKNIRSFAKTEPTLVSTNQESSSEMVELSNGKSQSSELLHSLLSRLEDKFSAHNVLGISPFIVALVAVAAFIYPKQINTTTSKKLSLSPVSASTLHVYKDMPSSPTEVDIVGESCPSEMSSFQKSSSYYSKRIASGTNEAQSHERKPRKNSKRESLASSEYSTGSPSYGSFTTYERIPCKNAIGDEEIVTPVRRSSRIRK